MSRSRRTYGRRPRTENVRSFMDDVKNSHEERKRSFEATYETSDFAPTTHVPYVSPFKLPQKPAVIEHQQPKRKTTCAFDEENMADQPRIKKQLPTPPAEPDSAATAPQSQKLTKSQKKRNRQKQRKKQAQLAMHKVNQQQPLTSPSPSAIDSAEACKSPRPPTLRPTNPISSPSENSASAFPSQREDHTITRSPPISANGGSIERITIEILKTVLSHILPANEGREVRPMYMKGVLRYGLRSEPWNDDGVIQNDNVDLSVLRTSQTFHHVGTRLFYGRNTFVFNDSDACS